MEIPVSLGTANTPEAQVLGRIVGLETHSETEYFTINNVLWWNVHTKSIHNVSWMMFNVLEIYALLFLIFLGRGWWWWWWGGWWSETADGRYTFVPSVRFGYSDRLGCQWMTRPSRRTSAPVTFCPLLCHNTAWPSTPKHYPAYHTSLQWWITCVEFLLVPWPGYNLWGIPRNITWMKKQYRCV